tara:strand:+ start:2140 stop:3924 length:1785 start_codon:yes stop_codon:yes gene_type:complete
MKVSIASNLFDTKIHEIGVDKALQRIKNGSSKETVDLIRSGDKALKQKLPIVLFSGMFSERKDNSLQRHSGFIVMDFDNLNDVQDAKMKLATDEHSYATWVSPSGNGVKVLVRVTNPEHHDNHFRALQKYFDKAYGLEVDSTGKNPSRACYESYDPDIVINKDCKRFGAMLSEKSENQSADVSHMTDYMKLNLAAKMVRESKDGERHDKLLRASRLCGGYISAGRMERDEVERVLYREFCRKDYDSNYNPKNTIKDGIDEGTKYPMTDIISDEKKIRREQMVENGDLSFISSDEEDLQWMSDFAAGRIQVGLSTGSEEMDKHFVYKRDFTIINGISNVGKTSFALYMIVNSSVRHGWKWLIYSAENKTASIKMKLLQYAMGRSVSQMTAGEMREGMKWVGQHFIVITNREVVSYTDLLVYAERLMVNGMDFDGFFIDPYNALKIEMAHGSSLSTHEYHYEAASEMLTFSNGNEKALWLNVHAFTEAQRRMGADGYVQAPQAADTEGGGKFVNRADNFLTFHRKVNHDEPNMKRTMEFHVRKVRETETGGSPTGDTQPISWRMSLDGTKFIDNFGSPLFETLNIQEQQSQINYGS